MSSRNIGCMHNRVVIVTVRTSFRCGTLVVCTTWLHGYMQQFPAQRHGEKHCSAARHSGCIGSFPCSQWLYASLCGLAQWSYVPLHDAAQWLCAPVNIHFINIFFFTYSFPHPSQRQSKLYNHQSTHFHLPLLFFLLLAG